MAEIEPRLPTLQSPPPAAPPPANLLWLSCSDTLGLYKCSHIWKIALQVESWRPWMPVPLWLHGACHYPEAIIWASSALLIDMLQNFNINVWVSQNCGITDATQCSCAVISRIAWRGNIWPHPYSRVCLGENFWPVCHTPKHGTIISLTVFHPQGFHCLVSEIGLQMWETVQRLAKLWPLQHAHSCLSCVTKCFHAQRGVFWHFRELMWGAWAYLPPGSVGDIWNLDCTRH